MDICIHCFKGDKISLQNVLFRISQKRTENNRWQRSVCVNQDPIICITELTHAFYLQRPRAEIRTPSIQINSTTQKHESCVLVKTQRLVLWFYVILSTSRETKIIWSTNKSNLNKWYLSYKHDFIESPTFTFHRQHNVISGTSCSAV